MRYLLDTNTCIKYLNGRSEKIKQHLESIHPEDIVLCSIVKAELFYGAMKSANPEKNLEKLEKFTNPFISLPFDDKASKLYGLIRSQLEKKGTPIGPNDLIIASISVANDITLITHNVKEFNRVENLRLEDWEIS
jgi:tRNA(fMet)-specific endonuclease VapC